MVVFFWSSGLSHHHFSMFCASLIWFVYLLLAEGPGFPWFVWDESLISELLTNFLTKVFLLLFINDVTVMNTEIITIYCRDYHFFFFLADDVIRENLTDYGYKVERGQNFEVVFDFTIVGRNVRIIVSGGRMKHCDVCIVGWRIDSTDYSATTSVQVQATISRCSYFCD